MGLDHLSIPIASRSKRLFALVEQADSDLLMYRWFVTSAGYVWSRINGKFVYMHRLILGRVIGRPLRKGEYSDHIKGDRLDNRRSMLRVASNTENIRNRRGKASGYNNPYIGVSFVSNERKRIKRWKAYYRYAGKQITVGYYKTPEEAAFARDEAIKPIYGEFGAYNNVVI